MRRTTLGKQSQLGSRRYAAGVPRLHINTGVTLASIQSLVAGQTQEGASAVGPSLLDTEDSILSSNSSVRTTVEGTHPQCKTDGVITTSAYTSTTSHHTSCVLLVTAGLSNQTLSHPVESCVPATSYGAPYASDRHHHMQMPYDYNCAHYWETIQQGLPYMTDGYNLWPNYSIPSTGEQQYNSVQLSSIRTSGIR